MSLARPPAGPAAVSGAGASHHGYDVFGLHRPTAERMAALLLPLYRHWFRVRSSGTVHLATRGPALLVANHGGVLPFDFAMLWLDVLLTTGRVPRAVADRFVPRLPFVGTLGARIGAVAGSRRNVHDLLDRGELLLVFPEGTRGVGKPRSRRYRLTGWTPGHAEMALRHRVPVIPVGIVGPDEQFPLCVKLPVPVFGAPYLPVSLIPVPLPVRYHIRYGAPLVFDDHAPDEAEHPEVIDAASARVAAAVQGLIDDLLAERDAAGAGGGR